MLKKISNLIVHFLASGFLIHHSTIIGVLCAVWVYFGAEVEESAFSRMLTPDLYLFMASVLLFYRFLFKKTFKSGNDLDWTAMTVCFLGDMLWATAVMFCTVPVFMMMFRYPATEYAKQAGTTAIDPYRVIRKIPRQ